MFPPHPPTAPKRCGEKRGGIALWVLSSPPPPPFFFGPSNAAAAAPGGKTGSESMAADGGREERVTRARDEMCIDRERDGHKNR